MHSHVICLWFENYIDVNIPTPDPTHRPHPLISYALIHRVAIMPRLFPKYNSFNPNSTFSLSSSLSLPFSPIFILFSALAQCNHGQYQNLWPTLARGDHLFKVEEVTKRIALLFRFPQHITIQGLISDPLG